jgi:flagellar biosynthesis/type III secretory pathway protein FliH
VKITAEDLQALYSEINKTMAQPGQHEARDLRVTNLLIDIYDRGFESGYDQGREAGHAGGFDAGYEQGMNMGYGDRA